MRIPLIAGNWKMNKTEAEAISLARVLLQRTRNISDIEILICPPFTSLSQLHKLLISSPIQLGAQNISDRDSGAFTGEISASMAAEFCSHVILGHSERRAYYGEDDLVINRKVIAARRSNLIPVLCVGESLPERNAGQAAEVIRRQLQSALQDVYVTESRDMVIAYEPVWAIGTGSSADPEEISNLIAKVIRPVLADQWGKDVSRGIRVLYGGSVKPTNARGFFSQVEIDGALVGGASLKAEIFLSIIDQIARN